MKSCSKEKLANYRDRFESDSPMLGELLADLANVVLESENYPLAESMLCEAMGVFDKRNSHDWQTLHVRMLLVKSLLLQNKFDEADAIWPILDTEIRRHRNNFALARNSDQSVVLREIIARYTNSNLAERAEPWTDLFSDSSIALTEQEVDQITNQHSETLAKPVSTSIEVGVPANRR